MVQYAFRQYCGHSLQKCPSPLESLAIFFATTCRKRLRSEMRQNGSCFSGKRGMFQNASEMRQNCVKNARNSFGGEHLLDDTEKKASPLPIRFGWRRGPKDQRSPKSLFCTTQTIFALVQPHFAPISHQYRRLFARWVQKICCTLSEPLLGIFESIFKATFRGEP